MTCPGCGTENVELVAQSHDDAKPDGYKCCECGIEFSMGS